jgi:murein L,D-transpeptidase YafK
MKKIILIFISLYVVTYILLVNISDIKYQDMDFNKNGFIELSEIIYSTDIRTRVKKTDESYCIEYFSLKDGLTKFEKCKKLPIADKVIVDKRKKELYLIKNNQIYRKYHVVFGANPRGHKQQEGDEKTPEGDYILDYKNPNSSFYKSIHISYPNKQDIKRAKELGVNPGGFIMIHGQKNHFGWLSFLMQRFNWTDGCIAVTNDEMDEIYNSIKVPTPIKILPFNSSLKG